MKKKKWVVLYLKPNYWHFRFYTGKTMRGGEVEDINEEEYKQIETNCPDDFTILSSPKPDKSEATTRPVSEILKPVEETKEKKHICPKCGKTFKTRMGLVSHSRVHKE